MTCGVLEGGVPAEPHGQLADAAPDLPEPYDVLADAEPAQSLSCASRAGSVTGIRAEAGGCSCVGSRSGGSDEARWALPLALGASGAEDGAA